MESRNNNITNNKQELCHKCNQFYGTAKTDFLCSTCYKETISLNAVELEKKTSQPLTTHQHEEVKQEEVYA